MSPPRRAADQADHHRLRRARHRCQGQERPWPAVASPAAGRAILDAVPGWAWPIPNEYALIYGRRRARLHPTSCHDRARRRVSQRVLGILYDATSTSRRRGRRGAITLAAARTLAPIRSIGRSGSPTRCCSGPDGVGGAVRHLIVELFGRLHGIVGEQPGDRGRFSPSRCGAGRGRSRISPAAANPPPIPGSSTMLGLRTPSIPAADDEHQPSSGGPKPSGLALRATLPAQGGSRLLVPFDDGHLHPDVHFPACARDRSSPPAGLAASPPGLQLSRGWNIRFGYHSPDQGLSRRYAVPTACACAGMDRESRSTFSGRRTGSARRVPRSPHVAAAAPWHRRIILPAHDRRLPPWPTICPGSVALPAPRRTSSARRAPRATCRARCSSAAPGAASGMRIGCRLSAEAGPAR